MKGDDVGAIGMLLMGAGMVSGGVTMLLSGAIIAGIVVTGWGVIFLWLRATILWERR